MSARDCILVTGGAGYIGSHFARLAVESGSRVVSIDSSISGLVGRDIRSWCHDDRLEKLSDWYGDIADHQRVARLIEARRVTSVVHFAGDICVAESIENPSRYYDRNVMRSLSLLETVRQAGVAAFVFSSSAAVYGAPALQSSREYPRSIPEYTPCEPINPYGATKLAFEHALRAYGNAYGIKWAALRYFNAAGAHPDGTLRENHRPETHLIPLAIDAALGRGPKLTIFGDDHETRDGTCERDYVHVMDLAQAHLDALDAIDRGVDVGAVNLGSGQGHTVHEVARAVAQALGAGPIGSFGPKREGDPAMLIASCALARDRLGWKPKRSDLETIIDDAIRSRRSE